MDKTKITSFIQSARQAGQNDKQITDFLKTKGVDLATGQGIDSRSQSQKIVEGDNNGEKGIIPQAVDKGVEGFKQIQEGVSDPNILSGLGKIAKGTLKEASAGLRIVFSPVEVATKIVSQLPVVKQGIEGTNDHLIKPLADAISNNPKLQKFMQEHPDADQVVGDALTVALSLAGGAKGAEIKTATEGAVESVASKVAPVVDNVSTAVKDASGKVVDTASALKEKVVGAPATSEELVGKITQGAPEDLASAKRALGTVDTKGVETFQDLSKKFDDQIKSNTKAVDTELDTSTTLYKPKDVTQTIKVQGGKAIKTDYVGDSLSQLEKFYDKTSNPSALAKVKELAIKYKKEGLTAKEINNLAREHGKNLNGFNANGELASGLSKQSAENTRTGLKTIARDAIPEGDGKALDANTSDLIKTKELIDDMATKVQKAQNKIEKAGILKKAGNAVGQGVDIITGGFIKSFFKNLIGKSNSAETSLSPVELQNVLSKNLSKLDTILKEKDPAKIEAKLKEIFNDLQPDGTESAK